MITCTENPRRGSCGTERFKKESTQKEIPNPFVSIGLRRVLAAAGPCQQTNPVPCPREQVPCPREQVPCPREQVPCPREQVPCPREQVPCPREQVPCPREQVPWDPRDKSRIGTRHLRLHTEGSGTRHLRLQGREIEDTKIGDTAPPPRTRSRDRGDRDREDRGHGTSGCRDARSGRREIGDTAPPPMHAMRRRGSSAIHTAGCPDC